ncbi:MAG: Eco57I restriction-modification methylase domain-containing protein [Bryobacteraceae bacterium]
MSIAPKQLSELVDRFDRNRDAYRSDAYNETQARREFIDPLFKLLGWDIDNQQGYAEAYKDVVHEDAIKVGEGTKAPDYCFRIGGTRKFFLEAKKPAVDIKNDVNPAFQLRRYAWTLKLPLSIVTDFEEFAVYDCRVKPDQKDRASVARVLYMPYAEYHLRWEEIASVFSRDAVLKGSFDKYAEASKAKRGTAEVDEEFLGTIESWRKELAENLARRNKHLSQRELNFAVQLTIDRIIFLRICEGRGIEDYGRLRALADDDQIYQELGRLFREADDRYNSGLFHFAVEKGRHESPDLLTLGLDVDDKLLRHILRSLYYPESPYVFSVLPADMLGQVYEQFLGKVIRLTEGHHARVDYKPEVKKAGGVYYTPSYIVEYIVNSTVGKLLEGKTPKHVAQLKILDPACGSGSFLLGAYDCLLKWHLEFYVKDGPSKWAKRRNPTLVQSSGGGWKLTIAERKRILLDNIYGVDIDAQAVETTKLSLVLKVLEGETSQTLQPQLIYDRALPDLSDNIKCGNSLIGPDFYQQQQMPFVDEEERYRLNVFDWKTQFRGIFHAGGFDAVIGNPPYISVELVIKDVGDYYLTSFKSAHGRTNAFALFLEKSLELLSTNGWCGMITSNRILTNTQLSSLRQLLLDNSTIERLVTFKKAVFKAAVDTTVITFQKRPPDRRHVVDIWFDAEDIANGVFSRNRTLQRTFGSAPGLIFNVRQRDDLKDIIKTITHRAIDLSTICDVRDGIILGSIAELFLTDSGSDRRAEKWLEGNEVSRYNIQWKGRHILYDESLLEEEMRRKAAKAKQRAKSAADYKKLAQSGIRLRTPGLFKQEKLLTRQNAKRLIGALDDQQYFVRNSLHCIIRKDATYDLKYILGLINSGVLDLWFQDQIGNTGAIFSQMKIAYIEQLPIRPVNFSDRAEKSRHDQMVKLVGQMLALHKNAAEVRTPHEIASLERRIQATDTQIDHLAYELYGLTAGEIQIVEATQIQTRDRV